LKAGDVRCGQGWRGEFKEGVRGGGVVGKESTKWRDKGRGGGGEGYDRVEGLGGRRTWGKGGFV